MARKSNRPPEYQKTIDGGEDLVKRRYPAPEPYISRRQFGGSGKQLAFLPGKGYESEYDKGHMYGALMRNKNGDLLHD
jgi:hypothetical protein